jgi:hypothetical protein
MYEMEGPQLAARHEPADCSAGLGSSDRTAKLKSGGESRLPGSACPRIAPGLRSRLDCE